MQEAHGCGVWVVRASVKGTALAPTLIAGAFEQRHAFGQARRQALGSGGGGGGGGRGISGLPPRRPCCGISNVCSDLGGRLGLPAEEARFHIIAGAVLSSMKMHSRQTLQCRCWIYIALPAPLGLSPAASWPITPFTSQLSSSRS